MKNVETTLYDDLLEGLNEMRKHLKGETVVARVETLSRSEQLVKTGEEVRSIRNNLKLSQSELANKLKMSVKTLQNWEQGRSIPNPHSLMLLRMAEQQPKLFEAVANL
ncbi:helix-turn-helix domain-containing protein [Ursidibacter sp. B-7004-1]